LSSLGTTTSVDWPCDRKSSSRELRAQIFIVTAAVLHGVASGCTVRSAMNERCSDVTCFNGQCGSWVIPRKRHTPTTGCTRPAPATLSPSSPLQYYVFILGTIYICIYIYIYIYVYEFYIIVYNMTSTVNYYCVVQISCCCTINY